MPSPKSSPPADDILGSMAAEHDLSLMALAPKSSIISFLSEMTDHVQGLTAKSFLPSMLCAADTLLGPHRLDFVSESLTLAK